MPAELATTLTATEADRLMQAEASVREFCGWHIAPSREVVAFRVRPRGQALFLKTLYLTDVTAIRDVTDAANVVVEDLADWSWTASGVIEPADYRYMVGKVFEVDFTHGYSSPPADVTGVVQSIAQRAVDNPGSLARTQDGPFSDTYAPLDGERAKLRPYRIPQSR